MTPELKHLQAVKVKDPEKWLPFIRETCEKYQINTKNRIASFLAQTAHESAGYTVLTENLNYSAKGLMGTFKKYFPTEALALQYERKPEKIANKVYADRMGNGDEASGEGFKYRGRGLIQLTGKDNYKACGDALGVDLVDDPDLVATPQYAALSAGWFWDKNHLNKFADANDMTGLTKRINGGTHGLDDRVARTQHAVDVLMA